MSHVIQVVLHCDGRCGAEYASGLPSVGGARNAAERAGWAAGTWGPGDGRRRYDYCPECKARRVARMAG
jgi:hypothetical protein